MEKMEVLLKSQGWTVHMHTRRKLKYVYASKRHGEKVKQVYIAPLSRVEQMTEDKVLAKLK